MLILSPTFADVARFEILKGKRCDGHACRHDCSLTLKDGTTKTMNISHFFINVMVQQLDDSQLVLNGIPRERFSYSPTTSSIDPEDCLKFNLGIDSPFFTFIRTPYTTEEAFSIMKSFAPAYISNRQEVFLPFLTPNFKFTVIEKNKTILEGGIAELTEYSEKTLAPIFNNTRRSSSCEPYTMSSGVPECYALGNRLFFSLEMGEDGTFKISAITQKIGFF